MANGGSPHLRRSYGNGLQVVKQVQRKEIQLIVYGGGLQVLEEEKRRMTQPAIYGGDIRILKQVMRNKPRSIAPE